MFKTNTDITIGFTGHRPSSLPWKYNESAPSCIAFKKDLYTMLEKAIQNGWTSFISGLAIGYDTIAAETVLELKKKYKDVKIYGAIPHPGQEAKWTDDAKARYKKLLKKLDDYVICSESYDGPETMYKRNQFIVDNSSVIVALWNGSPRSGTANTVNYAKKQGRKVRVINPKDYEDK